MGRGMERAANGRWVRLKDPSALPASTRRALTIQRSIAAHRIETKIDLDGAVPLEFR